MVIFINLVINWDIYSFQNEHVKLLYVIAQRDKCWYSFGAFFTDIFPVSPRFFLCIWYSPTPTFLWYNISLSASLLSHIYSDGSLYIQNVIQGKSVLIYVWIFFVNIPVPYQLSLLNFTFLSITVLVTWTVLSLESFTHSFFSFSVFSKLPSSLKYLLFFLTLYSHFHSFLGSHGLRPVMYLQTLS